MGVSNLLAVYNRAMNKDRLRQPFKSDYNQSLGVAVSCFVICEWNAVYCAERIKPGALNQMVDGELTAGQIAKKLLDIVRNMPPSNERQELTNAAQSFAQLVSLRNKILHGKPCTGPNGEARLSSSSVIEIPDLENAADVFSACSLELNRLLHGFLATYSPR